MLKKLTIFFGKIWTRLPAFYTLHPRTSGILVALDAIKMNSIAEQYKVMGYANVKRFINNQYIYNVNYGDRREILNFVADAEEPGSSKPDVNWSGSEVVLVNAENFDTTLETKKHALVMFFAPWCEHCKMTKPAFAAAAEAFREDTNVIFAAVDCVNDEAMCKKVEILGYPTIRYFSYTKMKKEYVGPLKQDNFIDFMKKAIERAA